MEGQSGVTRSMTDDLQSSDIQGDQMEDESGVTRSIIHNLDFLGDPTRSNGRRKWCFWKYH